MNLDNREYQPMNIKKNGKKWETLKFQKIPDHRGNITFIEGLNHISFEIARVYYLYDVPGGASRAGHAHLELEQVLIAITGSFDLHLDDGIFHETITLNRAYHGIHLQPGVWRVLDNFSSGSVCLALASMPFDEHDYIRDHDQFVVNMEEGRWD